MPMIEAKASPETVRRVYDLWSAFYGTVATSEAIPVYDLTRDVAESDVFAIAYYDAVKDQTIAHARAMH